MLFDLVEQYPDLRFSQILNNFDFVTQAIIKDQNGQLIDSYWIDEFHAEPQKLANRVKAAIDKLNNEIQEKYNKPYQKVGK